MIEVAETGRAGALAQGAAAAAGALAAASLRITGRGIAAFGALVASRLRAFAAVAGPMLRMFAGEFHASMLRVVAYACGLAAMALLGLEFVTPPHGSAVADAMPRSEWVEVNKPFPAFALTLPELGAPRYASWRHGDGGGRKDVMAFGALGSAAATAVIELYRPAGESESARGMTASIPDLRLSSGLPGMIETKFGWVAVEPFTDRAPGGERQCLKFSHSFEEARFELSGWFCNAGAELIDRRMITCALDRLTLVAAGSEPKLGALFAQAELKRTFCGQQGVLVAATPKRNDWIEAARDPRLRGRK